MEEKINLDKFLNLLKERESSDTVCNQYKDKEILNNLKLYLQFLLENKHDVILIGEAPGYRGCKITGIPFSSGNIIKESKHKMFQELRNKIKIRQVIAENTAKIFWDFIENKNLPILWNAFPFHPHEKFKPNTNRKPTKSEIKEGEKYLLMIYELFKPKKICSLGKVGEAILKNIFPDKEIIYIRHPSYGGKAEFIKGMNNFVC